MCTHTHTHISYKLKFCIKVIFHVYENGRIAEWQCGIRAEIRANEFDSRRKVSPCVCVCVGNEEIAL